MPSTPGAGTRISQPRRARIVIAVGALTTLGAVAVSAGVVTGAVSIGDSREADSGSASSAGHADVASDRSDSPSGSVLGSASDGRHAVVATWVVVPKAQLAAVGEVGRAAAAAARREVDGSTTASSTGRRASRWVVDRVRLTALGTRWAAADVELLDPSTKVRVASVVTLRRGEANAGWNAVSVDPGLVRGAGLATQAGVPVPPDVGGDPTLGAIVGTGALLLPGGFDGDASTRQEAAACADCEWRKRLNCTLGNEALCGGALFGCPVGKARYQILLRKPPATTFSVVGTICLGGGDELRTADQLATDVRDRFVEMLPRSRPSYQPADGALVNLPALFAANEPSSVGPLDFTLSGYRISLTAAAEWRWRFGDGDVLVTDSAGGRYPDRSVQHTYSRPGPRTVMLTSVWTGEFTVDGSGPFPVAGAPVALSADLAVQAREAGARLLSDD